MGVSVVVADKPTLDSVNTKVSHIEEMMEKTVPTIKRYGVRINKHDSNPYNRIEYIYDAVGMTPAKMNYQSGTFDYGSWKDVWFVRDNIPVMLGLDGKVKYKLNPNDYSKKEDGTASDVADGTYAGNVMSMIPKAWVHMSMDENYEYIVVADGPFDDTYIPIAHTKEDGTEVDAIFLSCYQGSLLNADGTNVCTEPATPESTPKLRSISGQWPIWERNAQQEIDFAKANGEGWFTRTWGQRQLVNAFLTVIGKNDNSQECYGGGLNNTYVDDRAQHYGMAKSGGLDAKGQFWGANDGTHQVKVFHMEDWWGNQWERIAGLINDHGIIKVSLTGPYNTTGEGYDVVPCPAPSGTNGGYASAAYVSKYGRIPIEANGSATTYMCDAYLIIEIGDIIKGCACGGCRILKMKDGYNCISLAVYNEYKSGELGACLSFI